MKTTHIYACYLPGSSSPDYIGSHAALSPEHPPSLQWRYEHCLYLGQGTWIDKLTGATIGQPRLNASTLWGATLHAMIPAERLAIRVEILESVDHAERWAAEARAIRQHCPQFNKALKDGPEARKAKCAAYQRTYRKGYMQRNPDKAEAKRTKDRERAAAKRAENKASRKIQPKRGRPGVGWDKQPA